jgi:hypothetical protein
VTIRIHPLWWGGGDASISKMSQQSLDGAQVVRERGKKAAGWVLGRGGGKTSNRTSVEHVLKAEPVVMTVWISELRREDEPERNVSLYVVLAGSTKSFIVDSQDVFVCRSYIRSQRVNGSLIEYLKEIKLDILHIFVVVFSASKTAGSYNVCLANKGNVSPKGLRCAQTDLSKRANMFGWCSLRVAQEICSDRASMLDGFKILNTRTVLASGCTQTRRGRWRHFRLYGTTLVIPTCLVCNHFKCQLIPFRL